MEASALSGKVICITRSLNQAKKSAELVKKRGGIPFIFPVVKQEPVELSAQDRDKLLNLDSYDYLVFTSANAVRFFKSAAESLGVSLNDLKVEVACVGPQTHAQAEIFGMNVSVVPDEFLGATLAGVLKKTMKPGARILYPRPERVSRDLKSELRVSGFQVDELVLYRTVPDGSFVDEAEKEFKSGQIHAVTFASGSAVKCFCSLLSSRLDLSEVLERVLVAVIGPSTLKAAEKSGIKVDVIPDEYTFPAMLDALEKAFAARER